MSQNSKLKLSDIKVDIGFDPTKFQSKELFSRAIRMAKQIPNFQDPRVILTQITKVCREISLSYHEYCHSTNKFTRSENEENVA
jgi:hypothetical protein